MNTINAIHLDRVLTSQQKQIDELTAQLREVTAYTKQLEAAVLSAPLIRTRGANPAEARYEDQKTSWFRTFRGVLDRAMYNPEREERRLQARVKSKFRIVRNRVETLLRRVGVGDDVPAPTFDDLWDMLNTEFAK